MNEEKTKEQEAKEHEELVRQQAAIMKKKSEITTITDNADLMQMYQDNADLGAENLAGELPLLKVHVQGRSTKNELADGSEPKDGSFFYKPTQQEFASPLTCHILTISKGFRAPGMEGKKEVFNQIVGGLILDEGDYRPFIMYVTGLKLSYLWDFGKAASRYTKGKPVRIPMFAMKVNLSTQTIPNSIGGKSWIIKYDIVKDETDHPVLVLDAGEFQFLKATAEGLQETISQLIEAKKTPEQDGENATPF